MKKKSIEVYEEARELAEQISVVIADRKITVVMVAVALIAGFVIANAKDPKGEERRFLQFLKSASSEPPLADGEVAE